MPKTNETVELSGRIDEVPVFPLPKLVMFPGTRLPLHIFEPRYRELFADALAGENKLIAIAQLKPGWESDYQGRPPIYPVAGMGRILRHVQNRDGTYDVLLDALARVQLLEHAPARSYRLATATVLRERVPKEGVEASDLSALVSSATRVAELIKRSLPGFAIHPSESDDSPARISDRIADQFILDPSERQDLLETLDVSARIRALTLQLAQLQLTLSTTDQSGTVN
jgi:Lon protease-like protein